MLGHPCCAASECTGPFSTLCNPQRAKRTETEAPTRGRFGLLSLFGHAIKITAPLRRRTIGKKRKQGSAPCRGAKTFERGRRGAVHPPACCSLHVDSRPRRRGVDALLPTPNSIPEMPERGRATEKNEEAKLENERTSLQTTLRCRQLTNDKEGYLGTSLHHCSLIPCFRHLTSSTVFIVIITVIIVYFSRTQKINLRKIKKQTKNN